MIKSMLITTGLLVSTLVFSSQNYVIDPQFTDFRSNKGESDVWLSHEDSKGGLGDVGSSGSTAFGATGSARIRFKNSVETHDFTAKPGMSQVVSGLPINTEMTYSLYYCDSKGSDSPSTLYYGVREVVQGVPLTGKVIAESHAHVRDLVDAPKGEIKNCFRQVSVNFNSGPSGNVEIFSLMEVDVSDSDKPDMTKDIEVRIDEFLVTMLSDD